MDKRFWILIDEIATPDPETADLRFHAYGKVGVQRNNQQLVVTLEGARVTFDRGTDGWRINNVRLLK